MQRGPLWWQRGVIYQIYPRSFMDSNGDGLGDLPGMLQRLEYLQWLGVDALWLSPIFPSPMADFGYDVADYTAIDPRFGTLADFDRLLAEAHRRQLKVLLDYIPNHTSEQHPWFRAARSSRDHPQRAWYLWHDPAPEGGPPNNWRSVFGGSAWAWDAVTGQYYYHAYLPEQPDLNWRHPAVQAAMLDVLRFWLDRGVDGFRVDALRQLIKDDQWRDNPPNPAYHPSQGPYHAVLPLYTADRPEVLDRIALMRRVVDAYEDRVLLGELYLPIDRLMTYYGVDGAGVHLPSNFHLLRVPWQARTIATLIETYEAALPAAGWPNWNLGNHDKPRLASRVGTAQTRVAAMLLLTLRGTPILYYGDELGMCDGVIPPECVQDPWERRVPGLGLGRDPARTPLPWDESPHAGFTTGCPVVAPGGRDPGGACGRCPSRSHLPPHPVSPPPGAAAGHASPGVWGLCVARRGRGHPGLSTDAQRAGRLCDPQPGCAAAAGHPAPGRHHAHRDAVDAPGPHRGGGARPPRPARQ